MPKKYIFIFLEIKTFLYLTNIEFMEFSIAKFAKKIFFFFFLSFSGKHVPIDVNLILGMFEKRLLKKKNNNNNLTICI